MPDSSSNINKATTCLFACTGQWNSFAASQKARLQELLHRELSYSGVINDQMSYSATPLAVVGIEK